MGDYSHEMPVDLEKERLITVAKNVSAQMNKNVRLPINSSFMCDGHYPSVNERAVDGKFRFWGSFESKFRYTNRGSVTAIIMI